MCIIRMHSTCALFVYSGMLCQLYIILFYTERLFYEHKNSITLNNIYKKKVYQGKYNTMWFNKDK